MHDLAAAWPTALLLDIDGTLVASNDAHAAAWSEACADCGIDRDASFFQPLIGMGADRIIPRILRGLQDDSGPGRAVVDRQAAIFGERYLADVQPTCGARSFVERANHDGFICVVASSGGSEMSQALLEIVGVAGLVRIPEDDAHPSKPAPDPILTALTCAGVSPRRAVMVGDTPYDMAAAGLAGVASVAVRCGGWPDADLTGAAEIFDDPAAILVQYDSSVLSRFAPSQQNARRS